MNEKYSFVKDISFPKSLFQLGQHLNLSSMKASQARWKMLTDEVLDCYRIDRFERIQALLHWYYEHKKFSQSDDDYFAAKNLDIGSVLRERQGASLSLAIIFQALAEHLDLNVEILLLPSDAIISMRHQESAYYFSALDGTQLTFHQLHCLVRAHKGNLAPMSDDYFIPVSSEEILLRLLGDLKSSALSYKEFELGFEVCNILIEWQGREVYWLRERAFMAQQMGCIDFACAELEDVLELDPHDPLQEIVKYHLYEMKSQQNIFH